MYRISSLLVIDAEFTPGMKYLMNPVLLGVSGTESVQTLTSQQRNTIVHDHPVNLLQTVSFRLLRKERTKDSTLVSFKQVHQESAQVG